MMRVGVLVATLVALSGVFGCGGGESSAPSRSAYTVTDLGREDGVSDLRINNQGEVVASSGMPTRARMYRNSGWTTLGTLGGDFSAAAGVNDKGEVVGRSSVAIGGAQQAFVWRNNQLQNLSLPNDVYGNAVDINNAGIVVVNTHGSRQPSYLVAPTGARTELSFLPYAINEAGQVIGFIEALASQAVLWQNGIVTPLSTPPGYEGKPSMAWDINDQGQIVGFVGKHPSQILQPGDTSQRPRAVLWDKGTITILGTFGGPGSTATAINNRGEIIGSADTPELVAGNVGIGPSYVQRPFIYREGKLQDLQKLLPDEEEWEIIRLYDINDAGQIVAYARNGKDGHTHYLLLTPTL
jgi:probable HAF family extracellular repeat protein